MIHLTCPAVNAPGVGTEQTHLAPQVACETQILTARCRYFTTPLMLLALHMAPMTWHQLALTGAAYAAMDAAAVYMFLFLPYSWPDGSTARFMW